MKVRVTSPSERDPLLEARWQELQLDNFIFANPYFSPEFTTIAAEVSDDVRLGVMEDGGQVIGFFPFQLVRRGIGGPVAGRLSDYQGVICGKQAQWNVKELVKNCGLVIWDFDHLVAKQTQFRDYHMKTANSPIMQLGTGFDSYAASQRNKGSNRAKRIANLSRKLEREIGPIRFEYSVDERDVFDRVIQWKSEQCRRCGVVDFFRELNWTVPLVERIWQTRKEGFAGLLSALFAGDRILAVHLGMRSRSVLHYWFPGYDREYGRYSPGSILLLKLAREAAADGIEVIDLGKGNDPYKNSFMTASIPLAEGSVMIPSAAATVRRLRTGTMDFLRSSRLTAPLRIMRRALRKS